MRARLITAAVMLASLLALVVSATAAHPNVAQTPDLILKEAQTVYFGNLARRQNGVPPLRWNKQLTDAARWFAWDSVENRPAPFCGHQDTQGNWPDYRARAFGFKGLAGAENAYCGYMEPQDAINGWMNSPGHRGNLLDPNSREIGLGYYRRASDGRGYVVQDFGTDAVYPPVIIENEAPATTTSAVNLYIYDRATGGGFAGMGPAAQMMVGNDACFTGAAWETYSADKTWNLTAGEGWRTVYVKTRDTWNRTSTVSDTIYSGATVPVNELGDAQMSTTTSQVTLNNLASGGLPQMQFSIGWGADDTFPTFGLNWGTGGRVNDAAAWGGTAFRLGPPDPTVLETNAWLWTTEFVKDLPMVAYVRLKVASNTSAGEVARVAVTGGGTRSLKGTDFAAPNQYQEFPLPFTFASADTFLIFNFWRDGPTDVYVDGVSIFTAPQPFTASTTWNVPGGNYRGQGVWVRYTNGGSQFSNFSEVNPASPSLSTTPSSLVFVARPNGAPPASQWVSVLMQCGTFAWQVGSNRPWLQAQAQGNTIRVSVNQAGMAKGMYQGTVTVSGVGNPGVAPVSLPVTLLVADQFNFLPLLTR